MFENGILANAQAAIAAGAAGALGGAGAAQDESGEQKKRKRKRVHDPNAPKRALTPYFLYMKINRPLIAKELGETAKPKDIADEGARRWGAMSESEKQVRNASLAFVRFRTPLTEFMVKFRSGKTSIRQTSLSTMRR